MLTGEHVRYTDAEGAVREGVIEDTYFADVLDEFGQKRTVEFVSVRVDGTIRSRHIPTSRLDGGTA